MVSVYGLVADPNLVEKQITTMHGVLPPEALTLIATWLQTLVQGPTEKFGIGLIVSILLALWSMWTASGMLMSAINVCYGEEETRGFISFNLRALALGAGLALFGTTALALFAVLPAALALLPLTDPWHEVLGFLRWPVLAGVAILALAIVYRYAPDRRSRDGDGSVGARQRRPAFGSRARSVSRSMSPRSAPMTRPTGPLAL